jgi:ABC-type nitrate/sulfonate/bicarbonate transport system permease component
MTLRHTWLLRALGITLALVLWEVGGRWLGDALFAPPSKALPELWSMLLDGSMLLELGRSLRQMAVGFGLACLIGMPLGVAMGRSRIADVIFHPWVSMLVVISAAALVPLFIVTIGTGFAFRVAIVFMASAWYITLTAYHGARGVPPRFTDVAKSFGASRLKTFSAVLLPAIFPYLITGARIGLVHAIRAMVVAEMFVITGFGQLIHQTGLDVSTAPLLALLITLMIVSLVFNGALKAVGRIIAPWYESRTATI